LPPRRNRRAPRRAIPSRAIPAGPLRALRRGVSPGSFPSTCGHPSGLENACVAEANFDPNVRWLTMGSRRVRHTGITKSSQYANTRPPLPTSRRPQGDTAWQHPLTGDYTVA
jgi:hypothetical protein